MIDRGRHSVLGIRISAIDYEAAVNRIVTAARDRTSLTVSALAVHGVMTGVLDREHRYRLNTFDMLAPDGQPVRWALQWLHRIRIPDRVYGPTLMLKTCRRAADEDLPVFLFGGTSEILEQLRENLVSRIPGLSVAGVRASTFRALEPTEREELVATIRDSKAAMVFVGLGCPRQEVWAYEFRESLALPLIAVGAAFSFHAGVLPQAPAFCQDRGLEWLYRLAAEPGRLWKRYLLLNPLYLILLAMQLTRLRRFDPDDCAPPSADLHYG